MSALFLFPLVSSQLNIFAAAATGNYQGRSYLLNNNIKEEKS